MLFFWKSWNKQEHKTLYALFTGLFFLCIIGVIIIYAFEDSWTIPWTTVPILDTTSFTLDIVKKGIFEIPIQIDTYYVQQKYVSENLHINLAHSAVWLILFGLVFSWLMTAITQLKRWSYLGAMAIIIFLIVGFRIDLLQVFGSYSQIIIGVVLTLYIIASYFFFAIKKEASLPVRFFTFAGLTTLTGIILITNAQVTHPVIFLTNYGMAVPFILSLFFIIIISNEIPHLFLYLVGRSSPQNSKNSIKHFTVITIIYLINLFLLFLKNAKIFELDIIYFDDFYILLISSIVGLWGVQKNPLYQKIMPFKVAGAAIYLSLAIITISCVAYASATMNAPVMAVYEDIIVYSHFAWGLGLLVYVIMNFYDYKDPQPIYQVTFEDQDDKRMPTYIFRGLGYMIFTGFLMKVDVFPYKQTLAGYYNQLGDVYHINEEAITAKLYYEKASAYDYYNKRTQFALASLANAKDNREDAVIAYKTSTFRDFTPQAYINLSEKFLEVDMLLEAIYTLREGLEKFPKNPQLHNNLALLYIRANVADSVNYYINRFENFSSHPEIGELNRLSFFAKNPFPDSLNMSFTESNDIELLTNRYAVLNTNLKKQPNKFNRNLLPSDSAVISWEPASYLYNYTLNQMKTGDSTSLPLIDKYMKKDENLFTYGEYLVFAKACYYFYNQEIVKAISVLSPVVNLSPETFNYVLGSWLLQAGDLDGAVRFYGKAAEKGDILMSYAWAVALTEAKQWDKALPVWEKLLKHPETNLLIKQRAVEIKRIFETGEDVAVGLSDNEKYGYIYYNRYSSLDKARRILASIQDENYRIAAIASLMNEMIKQQNFDEAEKLYQAIGRDATPDAWVQSEVNLAYLRILLHKEDYIAILGNIEEVPLYGFHENYRYFFRAIALAKTKKDLNVQPALEKAVSAVPFEEMGYLMNIELYNQQGLKDKAYSLAIQGIRFIPKSAALWKSYTQQCLEQKLITYAKDALSTVKQLIPAEEYQLFEKEILAKIKVLEEELYGKNTQ